MRIIPTKHPRLMICLSMTADRIAEHTVWIGLKMETMTGPFLLTHHVINVETILVRTPPNITMKMMVVTLKFEEPASIFPSIVNFSNAVVAEPIKEVTMHREKGAGKLSIAAACRTVVHDRKNTAHKRYRQPNIHSLEMVPPPGAVKINEPCNVVAVNLGAAVGLIRKLIAIVPPKHTMVPKTLVLLYLHHTENFSNPRQAAIMKIIPGAKLGIAEAMAGDVILIPVNIRT